MKLLVNERFKNLLPPLSQAEYDLLEADILQHGCRDKLVIWYEHDVIVDGHNRYEICQKHDLPFQTTSIFFPDEEAVMDWIDRNQLGRRNLDPEWVRYVQGRRYNREKKIQGGTGANQHEQSGNDFHSAKTAERHAQEYGVSEKTVRNAGKFAAAVDAKLEAEGVTNPSVDAVLAAAEELKREQREARRTEQLTQAEELGRRNEELPENRKYCVVYADPPWNYEFTKSSNRAIENHYPTMPTDDISALGVAGICAEDSVLFLWATPPKLEEALRVVNAWGFEYKTCAVWDKEKIGMGYWFRQQHEILLVATKGTPLVPEPEIRISSVIREPRSDHSRKPDSVRSYLESIYPNIPKIELFARSQHGTWDAWGNQAPQLSAEPELFAVNVQPGNLGGNLSESVP